VSEDYLKVYEEALCTDPKPDCVSLHGMLYRNGEEDRPFYHSLKYKEWSEDEQGYYRYPNHLNLIKTWIAKSAGFPGGKSYGEDHDFSRRLQQQGFLQTEYEHIGGVQYKYYYVPRIVTSIPPLLSDSDSVQLKGQLPHNSPTTVIKWASRSHMNDVYKRQSGLKYLI
jgi:hypothetical protein